MSHLIKLILLIIAVSFISLTEQINCAFCSETIVSEYIISDANSFHPHCYQDNILPKCSICIHPIDDKYLVDAWGNPFHIHHETEGIYCSSCSRIISEALTHGGYKLDDGRFLCSLCQANIIQSITEIEASRKVILSLLNGAGFNGLPDNISITLKNRYGLMELAEEVSNSNLKGFTQFNYTKSPFGRHSKNYKIYILDRLPKIEFEAVLAHEYLHVWIYENDISFIPSKIEGICNLASALVYEKDGSTFSDIHLRSMHADKNPIYGDGYREMKNLLDKLGLEKFLITIQNN